MSGVDYDEMQRAIQAHFDEFHQEMARRDAWLINSIWNVARSVTVLVFAVGGIVVCLTFKWTEWWQLALVLLSASLLARQERKKLDRLEEEDKRKIGMDCALGNFRFWGW